MKVLLLLKDLKSTQSDDACLVHGQTDDKQQVIKKAHLNLRCRELKGKLIKWYKKNWLIRVGKTSTQS